MPITNTNAIYALLSANTYGAANNDASGSPLVRSSLNTLPLPGPQCRVFSENSCRRFPIVAVRSYGDPLSSKGQS